MKSAVLTMALVALVIAQPRAAREFFVAPAGLPRNAGTADSPWDLRTALNNARGIVQPGDTVFLLDGTYRGHFSVRTSGSPGLPIKFKALPFTAPKLDGNTTTRTTAPIPSKPPGAQVQVSVASSADLRPGETFFVDVSGGRGQEVQQTSFEDGRILGRRVCPNEAPGQSCPEVPAGAEVRDADPVLTIPVDVHDVWFQGLEITDSGTDTRLWQTSDDDDFLNRAVRRRGGISDFGTRTRIIDCVVHDVANGVGVWTAASGAEYSGVITFNNGFLAPDRGHAHGWYMQHDQASARTLFSRIVSLNNFGYLGQFYTSGNPGVAVQGNVAIDRAVLLATDAGDPLPVNLPWLMGGGAPIRDVTVTNSVFYGKGPQWGYSNLDNENLDLAGNIFRTTPTLAKWKRVRVTNNVFAPVPADDAVLIGLRLDAEDNVPSDYVFERNTYYAPNGKFPNHQFFVTPPSPQNCGYFWWNETVNGYGYCPTGQSWQQTLGYDTNGSTYITDAPAGPSIKVIDDPYDPFRRFVVVFNWTVPKAGSIALDVSGFGWPRGVRYTLRNAADYYGDVQRGTYDGARTIPIPMTGHTVSVPYGYDQPLGANTFPDFGVFVLDVFARLGA